MKWPRRRPRISGQVLLASLAAACLSSCGRGEPPAGTTTGRPGQVAVKEEKAAPGLSRSIFDPRLGPLLQAAERWRRRVGPNRIVVDQVVLVPDVPTYLEVIAAWDQRRYFPILIDDPAWTLRFLRAFRPARVVRVDRPAGPRSTPAPDGEAAWQAAERAVALAWTSETSALDDEPSGGQVPRGVGPTPPALVLSYPDSPMLAGAVALAAGRFQPIARLEPIVARPGPDSKSAPRRMRFSDRLSLDEARAFAREVEGLAAAVTGTHGGLGDACDFLTLAGDWPYVYRNDVEDGQVRGEHAVDDLVGRILDGSDAGLAQALDRWAFTGRLLGDSTASVYRAMCALFLDPEPAILWNTYRGGRAWSDYGMKDAEEVLRRLWPRATVPVHREGEEADLSAWHRAFDPVNRFGWVMVNSSGGPRQFSIAGGPGRPADVPLGRPAAVTMIHSFSAADPSDPSTIAGRWLENGAFLYFGSMNEPFLQSFRPPKLTAELAAAGIPLAAALRQGESEPFGRPWRLVYLGDPLYRFRDPGRVRSDPTSWQTHSPESPRWTVTEITASTEEAAGPPATDAERLAWCRKRAISGLCRAGSSPPPGNVADRAGSDQSDWRSILLEIDRGQLDPSLRPIHDELVIDTLIDSGAEGRLRDWLLRIPPEQCPARLWRVIETLSMRRLARLAGARDLGPAFDLWDTLIRRPWPAGSEFPAQLTERVAALASSGPARSRETYRDRLTRAARDLAARPDRFPHTTVVQAELKRVGG